MEKKNTFAKGGFNTSKENIKKAYAARLKKLGRKPRTAKEHEEWRKKQRQKFKIW